MSKPNLLQYPAHPTNYTKGRGGKSVKYITIHHMAGKPSTLQHLFGDASRNGSTHLGVFPTKFEQYVQFEDSAWGNGNWASNQQSISIENWGDWRFGFIDSRVLANLKILLTYLHQKYPAATLTFHQDVSDRVTECPAQLRGHATRIWNEVVNPPTPAPTPTPVSKPEPKITYEPVKKKIELIRNASLWDFDFTSWNNAKAVKGYPKGHTIDVVAIATNSLGGKYYMTAHSYDNGKIAFTNGFNVVDARDAVSVTTPSVKNVSEVDIDINLSTGAGEIPVEETNQNPTPVEPVDLPEEPVAITPDVAEAAFQQTEQVLEAAAAQLDFGIEPIQNTAFDKNPTKEGLLEYARLGFLAMLSTGITVGVDLGLNQISGFGIPDDLKVYAVGLLTGFGRLLDKYAYVKLKQENVSEWTQRLLKMLKLPF